MAQKYYAHKTFTFDDCEIDCSTQDTRYGFRHVASMYFNHRLYEAKCCYYNRTWERYDYQSVIHDLIDKADVPDKETVKKRIDDQALGNIYDDLRTIGAVMALGDVFAPKSGPESAAWKLRMLRASFGDALDIPADFDQLAESEKHKRLDAISAMLIGQEK